MHVYQVPLNCTPAMAHIFFYLFFLQQSHNNPSPGLLRRQCVPGVNPQTLNGHKPANPRSNHASEVSEGLGLVTGLSHRSLEAEGYLIIVDLVTSDLFWGGLKML